MPGNLFDTESGRRQSPAATFFTSAGIWLWPVVLVLLVGGWLLGWGTVSMGWVIFAISFGLLALGRILNGGRWVN